MVPLFSDDQKVPKHSNPKQQGGDDRRVHTVVLWLVPSCQVLICIVVIRLAIVRQIPRPTGWQIGHTFNAHGWFNCITVQ